MGGADVIPNLGYGATNGCTNALVYGVCRSKFFATAMKNGMSYRRDHQ
jgi:hypothetical protein